LRFSSSDTDGWLTANRITDGLLAEIASIYHFNLASLRVAQLLVATHFTYLLPEKKSEPTGSWPFFLDRLSYALRS